MATQTKPSLPTLPCFCSTLRRSSRAVTQLYEQTLRPLGLRATQFTILQVLSRIREASQGQLGEILAIDSTTLTRTLEIMHRHGWIAARPGKDRRERWLRLAKPGEARLTRALPAWENVQARVRHRLGEKDWQLFQSLANAVTNLTQGDEL